jgi:hypothetical protein
MSSPRFSQALFDISPCDGLPAVVESPTTRELRQVEGKLEMAGEVYYMTPGHTMAVDAGTVLIEFSPKEESSKLSEIAQMNLARLNQASHPVRGETFRSPEATPQSRTE